MTNIMQWLKHFLIDASKFLNNILIYKNCLLCFLQRKRKIGQNVYPCVREGLVVQGPLLPVSFDEVACDTDRDHLWGGETGFVIDRLDVSFALRPGLGW